MVFDLASIDELDIVKTFECGQCFRWNSDDKGVYRGIAFGYPAKVWNEDGRVLLDSNAPQNLWNEYFDLDINYSEISKPFLSVPYLDDCTKDGMGIRILKQEPWEALCSFIISQCNNIKRIKGIVERLCTKFGDKIEYCGEFYYSFPSADRISRLSVSDLDCLKSGYRAPYIIEAAQKVTNGELDIEQLKKCSYSEAKKQLKSINGVGDKVANCVVLFGLHHMEAFPVDVWIKRALSEHFPKNFNPETLGKYAGLAQQYIFYSMRGQ